MDRRQTHKFRSRRSMQAQALLPHGVLDTTLERKGLKTSKHAPAYFECGAATRPREEDQCKATRGRASRTEPGLLSSSQTGRSTIFPSSRPARDYLTTCHQIVWTGEQTCRPAAANVDGPRWSAQCPPQNGLPIGSRRAHIGPSVHPLAQGLRVSAAKPAAE